MDFMIFVGSIAQSWCLGFDSLSGLGVSYGILWETIVLVWFYSFDCFCYFWVRDEQFMDFVIFLDPIAFPWCMGI